MGKSVIFFIYRMQYSHDQDLREVATKIFHDPLWDGQWESLIEYINCNYFSIMRYWLLNTIPTVYEDQQHHGDQDMPKAIIYDFYKRRYND